MNFQQSYLYWLAGAVLLIVAVMSRRIKRTRVVSPLACFGAYTAYCFCLATGHSRCLATSARCILPSILRWSSALIAGFGGVKLGSYHQRTQQQREESASRPATAFFPALAIPVVTVIGVLMFNHIPGLQDALFGPGNHATLVTLFP